MNEQGFYAGTPFLLSDNPDIEPRILQRLAEVGLLDAEQFLDMSEIAGMQESLAKFLDISPDRVFELAAQVSASLPARSSALEGMDAPLAFGALEPLDDEGPQADLAEGIPSTALALPPYINHASAFSTPRNQGSRGTCVAFAVTAVHEFYAHQNGGSVDYSEQFLYDEIKKIDGIPGTCGTWQTKAAAVLSGIGQCRESTWPYNRMLPCNGNGTQPTTAMHEAASHKMNLIVLDKNNVKKIKVALAKGAVVGFSVPVFDSWTDNNTSKRYGRITLPLPDEISDAGHAMCIIGYQDDASSPGGGYFILRNSWYGSWGQQCQYGSGNGIIPYEYIAKHNREAVSFSI